MSTMQPASSSSLTAAKPTDGRKKSTRQVTNSPTRLPGSTMSSPKPRLRLFSRSLAHRAATQVISPTTGAIASLAERIDRGKRRYRRCDRPNVAHTSSAEARVAAMQEAVVGLHQNLAHGRTQIVTNASIRSDTRPADAAESPQAWLRLVVALAFATIGSVGVWSFIVSLPAVQADFGVDRADASLPYTCLMIGFALGGVLTGRLADRFGIVVPLLLGALSLTLGYIAAALAGGLWQLALVHGTLIGIGTSTTFGPLVADISHWFTRRRGIAVAICASGGYFAGTIWPPIVRHFVDSVGWRHTHLGIGVFCAVTLFPLALLMRKRTVMHADGTPGALATGTPADLGLSPGALQLLLSIAGVACCVAMAMPQVHLVAYCGDLGYGVARGAEMLSVMLAFGIVSRIGSGWIADRIGGITTLLLGSTLQGIALVVYLIADGLTSLYL